MPRERSRHGRFALVLLAFAFLAFAFSPLWRRLPSHPKGPLLARRKLSEAPWAARTRVGSSSMIAVAIACALPSVARECRNLQEPRAKRSVPPTDSQFEWFERHSDCRESEVKGSKGRGAKDDESAAAQGLKRVRQIASRSGQRREEPGQKGIQGTGASRHRSHRHASCQRGRRQIPASAPGYRLPGAPLRCPRLSAGARPAPPASAVGERFCCRWDPRSSATRLGIGKPWPQWRLGHAPWVGSR